MLDLFLRVNKNVLGFVIKFIYNLCAVNNTDADP